MKKNKIQKLLEDNNAFLLRNKKHKVWRLPFGKNFVMSSSSSDVNSERVQIRLLNKILNENN